jgi:hypothetical protein
MSVTDPYGIPMHGHDSFPYGAKSSAPHVVPIPGCPRMVKRGFMRVLYFNSEVVGHAYGIVKSIFVRHFRLLRTKDFSERGIKRATFIPQSPQKAQPSTHQKAQPSTQIQASIIFQKTVFQG